ncbi:SVSP family protein [Theileria parva strain Muguga]|uniref:Theileria-specific sub-telomeric protein, SVSP family n=1 Tax=Theileria parva TaxID=5875 RepID=Q4N3M3_THEPA|nr:SVSP family protein [Theileria parva strain Muguga]EAN32285.1 SVSP family protein [Theileria parva strain Muguga]|eukprot:XP_764568.1 hypothetical protein [Theileria parva strain Muguga]
MRCVTYKCVLIFIIIKCVKSQDNNPDQPADEEDEEDNFEVLDLDKIIQQRLDRFEDPQYQPQPEPQYQPEPDQYQQVLQYQPETTYYQQELSVYQPQQYDQYQPQHYQSYQAPTHPTGQQYVGYQYYEQSGVSQPGQYYIPPVTQPTQQPSYQNYYPGYPPHQPSYQHQYYEPPVTQPAQQPSYQYYLPPPTQPQQPQYQYYQPTTTQTEVTQPPHTQPQTIEDYDNFYVTEQDQPQQVPTAADTGFTYGPTQPTQPTPIPPTQHVPPTTQEPTQQSIKPQKKPRKRKRTQTTSGDEEEEKQERIPKRRRCRQIGKTKNIKFYKRNNLGNLEEMNVNDYLITFSDKKRKDYEFIAELEQLHCKNEVIYEHIDGTPYCSLLSQSRETNVFALTNSQGFTLIRKTKGGWTKNDYKIPENIKLLTQDSLGNEVIITADQYSIHFTSNGSFRYVLLTGVKCCKIIVEGLIAWEKTDEDDAHPTIIYLSEQLTVTVKFEKYTKMFERRTKYYKLTDMRLNVRKPKYI